MEQTWVNWNTFRDKLEHRQGYIGAQTGVNWNTNMSLIGAQTGVYWNTDRGNLRMDYV